MAAARVRAPLKVFDNDAEARSASATYTRVGAILRATATRSAGAARSRATRSANTRYGRPAAAAGATGAIKWKIGVDARAACAVDCSSRAKGR